MCIPLHNNFSFIRPNFEHRCPHDLLNSEEIRSECYAAISCFVLFQFPLLSASDSFRTPTRLPCQRVVIVERLQQILRHRRNAEAQGSAQAREARRAALPAPGRDQMVRIGAVLQQRVLQLVDCFANPQVNDYRAQYAKHAHRAQCWYSILI